MAEVLYIAGWGRSGSTLLARILGEHPSMTFVGEVRGTFLRGVVENRKCGCGATFHTCPFWTAVGEEAFGGWAAAPVDEALRLRERVDKPWRLAALRRQGGRRPIDRAVARYTEIFTRVVDAVQAVVGPDQVVIDSSKIPSFGHVLGRMARVRLRVVHLVRDARGSVHSWQKHVERNDTPDGADAEMLRYGVPGASLRYVGYNLQAERLGAPGPRTFLRYEDLVTRPETELDRIVAELGLPGWRAGQLGAGSLTLSPSHSVVGNPMRMHTGALPLRRDEAWRDAMSTSAKAFTTVVTSPVLARYGYSLRPGTEAT